MHGHSFSAKRIQDGPKSSTTFGEKVEPSALPCRDDVLVENGATTPKLCLSPLEMRPPTTAGGLLPTGKPSTMTRITFYQPHLRFCPTEETNSERTSAQYVLYYNSSFWWNPPGGNTNKIKAKSDIRSRRFRRSSTRLPVFGDVTRVTLAATFFWRLDDLGINLQERDRRIISAVCIAGDRCFLRS